RADPWRDHERGEIRLVIAVADQEERLAGKVAREAIEEPGIVAEAHALAPQIFVDVGSVSRIRPCRHQVGPPDIVPGVMVLGQIDEEKNRPLADLARDHPQRYSD